MIDVQFDDRDWKKLEKSLLEMRKNALPYAVNSYLNSMAFETQGQGKKIVQNRMILRNKYTLQSIRANKATRSNKIESMRAATGSTAGYMETQEFGGIEKGDRGKNKPIATPDASGESGSGMRKKMPTAANRLSRISLKKTRVMAHTRKQANFIRVKMAMKTGQKYVYIDTGRRRFIAKISAVNLSKRGAKFMGARLRMVYDLSRKSVSIRKNKWLEPATGIAMRKRDVIYTKAIQFQIDRLKIFKN